MSEKVLNPLEKKYSTEDHLGGDRRTKSGANRWQSLISTNAAIAIGSRLSGNKSEIYVNGMCVRLNNNRFSYPNIVIVSGEPSFTDQNLDVLLNPTAVIEIFSSATNSSNKTEKLESYLAMESIRECLMVKEDEMRIEHFARQNAKQWIYRIYNEREDVVALDSINCKVSLSEIYAQIKLKTAEMISKAVS